MTEGIASISAASSGVVWSVIASVTVLGESPAGVYDALNMREEARRVMHCVDLTPETAGTAGSAHAVAILLLLLLQGPGLKTPADGVHAIKEHLRYNTCCQAGQIK